MGQLHLRPVTADDTADIARVHVMSWRETYAGLLPAEMLASLDVDARRRMWASVLSVEDSPWPASAFVVESAGRVVGFVAFGDQRSSELAAMGFDGEVGAIYILNQARGLGAGRLLMAATATALLSRGKIGLSLWVLAGNREARTFYERLGGQLVRERTERTEHAMLTEVAYGWPELSSLAS